MLGLFSALLPVPESRRCAVRFEVNGPAYSCLIGTLEAPVGLLGFFFGAIGFITGDVPFLLRLLVENWSPSYTTSHLMGSGLVSLLAWCLHPIAWLLALQGTTGVVRLVAYATSGESVGEPLVWAVLRISQALRNTWLKVVKTRDQGPLRPDRLVWGASCDLEIISCRDRPEWHDGVTLQVEDRFLRYLDVTERVEEDYHVLVYRFQELDPNEVLRGLVRYSDVR